MQNTAPNQQKKINKKVIVGIAIISIVLSLAVYYLTKKSSFSLIALIAAIGVATTVRVMNEKMKGAKRIKKMEESFPDFLELMSSNLRAGMTIDKALLASSREEFAPLDAEITKLGKDIATGKNIERALKDMADRINSERMRKTLLVIISGIKAGGNLATLLEETAVQTRERGFVEKRAASNVLMYVIFIFFALAIGAPVLFGLSAALVGIITQLLATIPPMEGTTMNLPFTLTKVSISPEFITGFSLVFLIMTDILGSLVLGSVSKGEEKAGAKYIVPLIIISLAIFFIVKTTLLSYFSGFLG